MLKYKYLSISFLFILGILGGMIIYSTDWFPTPQLRSLKYYIYPSVIPIKNSIFIDKIITTYTKGIPLFYDRDYYDTIGDTLLENTFLIQIPRHLTTPIELDIIKPVTIYRLLSPSNDNSMFNDWKLTNIKIKVIGLSCEHNLIVSKNYNSGKIILESGGSISSSPIFIKDLSNPTFKIPFSILNVKSSNKYY